VSWITFLSSSPNACLFLVTEGVPLHSYPKIKQEKLSFLSFLLRVFDIEASVTVNVSD